MGPTDGSWQDITASYVRDGPRHVGQDDRLDSQHISKPLRRPLPRPPLPEPPVETPAASSSIVEESEMNLSSDSWASLHSDNVSQADTSTESTAPYLPGAFASSAMSPNLSTYSNTTTTRESQYAMHLKQEDHEDPFSSGIMPDRPSSAKSTSKSESTVDTDWIPPIASPSSTPRKHIPKSRQYAVRSPRSARPAQPVSPYGVRSVKPAMSSSLRSVDSQVTPRRRKGSSVSREDSPGHSKQEGSNWLSVVQDVISVVYTIVSLPIRTLASALGAPVRDAVKWIIILSFFTTVLWYVIKSPLQSALGVVSGASSIISIGPMLYSGLTSPVRVYCDTIGIGCSTEHEKIDVGRLAKHVGTQALQAHDMFTSVVALGDPAALALNHVEIWELAVAVQVSSGMENREDLGKQLAQFGNKIRDVKDAMYVLHSKGITTFQWALHRFTRLEKTIALAESKPNAYTAKRIKKQLDDLFQHLDDSLKDLLRGVETAIPIANQASDEGGMIRMEFGSEKQRMQKARDDQPFWRRLKDIGTFAGRQLREDIRMTTDTIDTVRDLRSNLENTRSFLLAYRDQVGYFKSGFQGFHIGDHGLEPEDEVATLREIMQRFEDSVEKARYASSPEGLRESINARQKTLGD